MNCAKIESFVLKMNELMPVLIATFVGGAVLALANGAAEAASPIPGETEIHLREGFVAAAACPAPFVPSPDAVDFVTTGDRGNEHFFPSNMDGTFGTRSNVPGMSVTDGTDVADMDNDGDNDFLYCDGTTAQVCLYTNDGAGTYTTTLVASSITRTGFCTNLRIADFDGDGLNDFVVGDNRNILGTKAYLQNPVGTFTVSATLDTSFAGSGNSLFPIATGDINGDADVDILVLGYASTGSGEMQLYAGDGAGGFGTPTMLFDIGTDFGIANPTGLAVLDLEQDGDLDIVAGGAGDGSHFTYTNDGAGTFTAPEGPAFDVDNYTGLDGFDIDEDGTDDLIIVTWSTLDLRVALNTGGSLSAPTVEGALSGNSIGVGAPPLRVVVPIEIDIKPEFAFNPVGAQHTITATLTDGLGPVPDVELTFEVFAGPNGGDGGTDVTDVDGEATFTYIGDGGEGVDQIEAFFVEDGGETITSNEALKFWDEDCQDPPNGIPDTCDIDCDGFDGFCSEFAGCGGSTDDDGNGVPDECIILPIVSYGVEGGLPHSETLDGTPVRPVDAVEVSTGDFVFSAFPDTILEDIDAFHVMPDGSVVFSTSTDVTQGFGGLSAFKNGDLILWDGAAASLLFSEVVGFGSPLNNIDAFSILPNGNWLLSTDLPAFLGGLSFQNGDIVEYDPVGDVATLYMGLDEATIFTGTPQSNADIDALHVTDDGVIFSIRSNGIGRIGDDLTYGWPDVASTDLFLLDPVSGHAELFLDGDGLFDGVARNLDAVSLSVPAQAGGSERVARGSGCGLGYELVLLLPLLSLLGRRRR